MRKGICKRGHILDDSNSYIRKDGSRSCKICAKQRQSIKYSNPISRITILTQQNNYYYKNKNHINEQNRIRWHKNKDKYRITSKKWHEKTLPKLKEEVLTHYGNGKLACVCCGIDEIVFLTLDHINGREKGDRGRNPKKKSGRGLWAYLKKRGYPKGYQTLCWNCNSGRQINKGICPHKEGEK